MSSLDILKSRSCWTETCLETIHFKHCDVHFVWAEEYWSWYVTYAATIQHETRYTMGYYSIVVWLQTIVVKLSLCIKQVQNSHCCSSLTITLYLSFFSFYEQTFSISEDSICLKWAFMLHLSQSNYAKDLGKTITLIFTNTNNVLTQVYSDGDYCRTTFVLFNFYGHYKTVW